MVCLLWVRTRQDRSDMMVSTGIFEWVTSKHHDVDGSFEVDGNSRCSVLSAK